MNNPTETTVIAYGTPEHAVFGEKTHITYQIPRDTSITARTIIIPTTFGPQQAAAIACAIDNAIDNATDLALDDDRDDTEGRQ